MSASLGFLGTFIKNPRSVGAVWPSGPALSARMVEGLDIPTGRSVVEFGPGTGPFTQALSEQLACPSQYLGVELNGGFVKQLESRFPDFTFAHGGAAEAPQFVNEHNLAPVQAIVCGLPFASLPAQVQDGVIQAIDTLLPDDGQFRTFQYVHAYGLPSAVRYRKRMQSLFGACQRSTAVWANMPPAYVLTWRRD